MTSLGSTVFGGCTKLAGEVNLLYVTSIGNTTFWGCSSITGVTFSYNLTTIGTWAFASCTSLTSNIEIPTSVTNVGYVVFRNTKITSLTFLGDSTEITPGYWDTKNDRGYRTLR